MAKKTSKKSLSIPVQEEELKAAWEIEWTKSVAKSWNRLPSEIADSAYTLKEQLKYFGPAVPNFPSYGKLHGKKNDERHCHLNKGKPRYVAIWIVDKLNKTIKFTYLGTHEGAPY